jgi:hypothetical protein
VHPVLVRGLSVKILPVEDLVKGQLGDGDFLWQGPGIKKDSVNLFSGQPACREGETFAAPKQ